MKRLSYTDSIYKRLYKSLESGIWIIHRRFREAAFIMDLSTVNIILKAAAANVDMTKLGDASHGF